jgi:hypothetical protein
MESRASITYARKPSSHTSFYESTSFPSLQTVCETPITQPFRERNDSAIGGGTQRKRIDCLYR